MTTDLQKDLERIAALTSRRRMLSWILAGGATTLLPGCGYLDGDPVASADGSGTCRPISSEMAGPYPGDGSNEAAGSVSNVLSQKSIVRSDIRSSFGVSKATAPGVPLTLTITLVNANDRCKPLSGYAVYLWHCTREGEYSLYANGIEEENFLRGVQVSDNTGSLTFQTIFAGCYANRYPHLHFEVYPTLALATGYANRILTSQLALPMDIAANVYNTAEGYRSSADNFANLTWWRDFVFINNSKAQLALMTPALSGSVAAGYTGRIKIGLRV